MRRQRRSPDGIQASRAGRPNSGVAAEGARLLWCSVARPGPPRRCEPSCGAQVLPEDVLVMGSDGLFDNVAEDEILDIVVKVRYQDAESATTPCPSVPCLMIGTGVMCRSPPQWHSGLAKQHVLLKLHPWGHCLGWPRNSHRVLCLWISRSPPASAAEATVKLLLVRAGQGGALHAATHEHRPEDHPRRLLQLSGQTCAFPLGGPLS